MSTDHPTRIVDVPEFPGYQVGSDGSVWSLWTRGNVGRKFVIGTVRHPLVRFVNHQGYEQFTMWRNRKRYLRRVAHIILEAFVGPRPPGFECRHLDGNRTNNNLYNLKWGTKKENADDKRRHGTMCIGVKNGCAKLHDEDVREIRKLLEERIPQRKIAARFGVSKPIIQAILHKKNWSHVV